MNKVCRQCGQAFDAEPRKNARAFCSDSCRNASINARRTLTPEAKAKYAASRRVKYRERQDTHFRSCQHCRSVYVRLLTPGSGYKYCSSNCKKKGTDKLHNLGRRAKKLKAPYREAVHFVDVFEKSGGRCCHCSDELSFDERGGHHDRAPEIDHIVPLSIGGHHALYNAQLLCRRCNMIKGNSITVLDANEVREFFEVAGSPEAVERLVIQKAHALPPVCTSGYRGVTWDASREKWVARVTIDGKRVKIGQFDRPELAGAAAMEAREKEICRNKS